MKYRKKPVVIEAWQWLTEDEWIQPPAWFYDATRRWPEVGGICAEYRHPDGPRMSIATLEGVMIARPGDWIIKDIAGELYACKPEIFDATYEPVVDQ